MKACSLLVSALAVSLMVVSCGSAEAACAAAPLVGCKAPFTPHHSILSFRQTGRTDPDDIFTWKWRRGSQTTVGDFGDPTTMTDYVLCIYDQSARAQPVVEDAADDPQGWAASYNGFIYRARFPHALLSLRLHAGDDGKATISAHGDSDTVAPLLPFVAPVIIQVQASSGECWETEFATPVRSNADAFLATD